MQSEGEQLRVVKVGAHIETVLKQASNKQRTSSATGGAITHNQTETVSPLAASKHAH